MTRRRLPLAAWSSYLLVAAACATPGPAPIAQQQLVAAEASVTAGDYDAAIDTLLTIEGLICPKALRDRRDLLTARAEFGRGDAWEAFLALETFSDLHPHSELRGQTVELLWRIGKQLTQSDGGFLFFWSDRRAGRTVLEHLITRHPDTQRLADALQILGDMAFEDGDFELAQQRFRDIMLNQPDSDWRFYAQFRFAMSIVAGLQGSDYDLDRMQHAVGELRRFLSQDLEDPKMREQAEGALTQMLQWQVERHLSVAEFYRTVGSRYGERHHLELATSEEFAEAPAYQRAVAERARFLSVLPAEQPGSPGGGGS